LSLAISSSFDLTSARERNSGHRGTPIIGW
jgi:hypothetical protein